MKPLVAIVADENPPSENAIVLAAERYMPVPGSLPNVNVGSLAVPLLAMNEPPNVGATPAASVVVFFASPTFCTKLPATNPEVSEVILPAVRDT